METSQERLGTRLLALDGALLALVGGVQILSDLASHFIARGPLAGRLAHSPATLGFVEAHGLALILGLVLIERRGHHGARWHWVAAAIHLLLGGANLLLWPTLVGFDMVTPGKFATLGHAVFFVLQTVAASQRDPELLRGPGATFRIATLVTLMTGLGLHGAGLVLGRETFVERIYTPGVDMLLTIPMTWATVVGWTLFRRARCRTVAHRTVLTVMLAYFSISIPIHLRTLFTWRTDYVLAFPDWYSIPILALMLGFTVFAIRLRFDSTAPGRSRVLRWSESSECR